MPKKSKPREVRYGVCVLEMEEGESRPCKVKLLVRKQDLGCWSRLGRYKKIATFRFYEVVPKFLPLDSSPTPNSQITASYLSRSTSSLPREVDPVSSISDECGHTIWISSVSSLNMEPLFKEYNSFSEESEIKLVIIRSGDRKKTMLGSLEPFLERLMIGDNEGKKFVIHLREGNLEFSVKNVLSFPGEERMIWRGEHMKGDMEREYDGVDEHKKEEKLENTNIAWKGDPFENKGPGAETLMEERDTLKEVEKQKQIEESVENIEVERGNNKMIEVNDMLFSRGSSEGSSSDSSSENIYIEKHKTKGKIWQESDEYFERDMKEYGHRSEEKTVKKVDDAVVKDAKSENSIISLNWSVRFKVFREFCLLVILLILLSVILITVLSSIPS